MSVQGRNPICIFRFSDARHNEKTIVDRGTQGDAFRTYWSVLSHSFPS
jgi:hypothetical protein